jgi:hypothetical protein
MHWLRSHARWGTALALLALTCQLALGFGHVHLLDGAEHTPSASTSVLPSFDQRQAAATTGNDDEPAGPPDEYCAVCAIASLIATSRVADPPALPALFLADPVQVAWYFETRAAKQRPALSRARAPPPA